MSGFCLIPREFLGVAGGGVGEKINKRLLRSYRDPFKGIPIGICRNNPKGFPKNFRRGLELLNKPLKEPQGCRVLQNENEL
jgi:hypothetical protein